MLMLSSSRGYRPTQALSLFLIAMAQPYPPQPRLMLLPCTASRWKMSAGLRVHRTRSIQTAAQAQARMIDILVTTFSMGSWAVARKAVALSGRSGASLLVLCSAQCQMLHPTTGMQMLRPAVQTGLPQAGALAHLPAAPLQLRPSLPAILTGQLHLPVNMAKRLEG